MKHATRGAVALWMVILALPVWGFAQEQGPPVVEEQKEVAAPLEPASPPPGEEVMTPTQRGVRFTRGMVEAFCRMVSKTGFGAELNTQMGLSPKQQDQMTEIMTKRAWELNLRRGREGCEAVESFIEGILAEELTKKRISSADAAREFSRKVRPGVSIIDELWNGLLEDAKPVLDEEQYAKFKERVREVHEVSGRFDAKMERWSRGELKANEGVMDDVEHIEAEAGQVGKSKEYLQAEQNVRWQIDFMGPGQWQQFLRRVAEICQFDEGQERAGRKLLGEYRAKAAAIMTPQWRAKSLANRVRRQIEDEYPQQPLAPWSYHLDVEYKQLTEPVQEMGRAFHRDVLALATSEQRDRLFGELRKLATDHGMRPEETEGLESWLVPPQTQPETHGPG